MKKVVVSTLLGLALLTTGQVANAEKPERTEQRLGFGRERGAASSPLDLARWLARRLNEEMAVPVPLFPVPTPRMAPVTGPTPNDGEGEQVCPFDRVHCPTG